MKIADVKIGEIYTESASYAAGYQRLKAVGIVQQKIGYGTSSTTRRAVQLARVDEEGQEVGRADRVTMNASRLQPWADYQTARDAEIARMKPAYDAKDALQGQLTRLGYDSAYSRVTTSGVSFYLSVEDANAFAERLNRMGVLG